METISDEMFVKEMQILWQNSTVQVRNQLGKTIRNYFDKPGVIFLSGTSDIYPLDRAMAIIGRMQEKID